MKPMFVVMLFLSFSINAEIFSWLDENGDAHFSDKPHPHSKQLKIDAGYTYYRVKRVFDGDTVLLANGNKVRFLGVNTPEVDGRNKVAQVGGEEAKRWLIDRLKNKKVRLLKDVEKSDKYGRLLAHLFTEDNEHINLKLVEKGLAAVNIYPPNLKYTDQLLAAQQSAEQERKGIWGYANYLPKQAGQIKSGRYQGWQRVTGKIKKIRQTRKYSYLKLTEHFSIKIAIKSAALFSDLKNYVGKKVEVRGWINKYKDRYSMFVRHPSSIILLD